MTIEKEEGRSDASAETARRTREEREEGKGGVELEVGLKEDAGIELNADISEALEEVRAGAEEEGGAEEEAGGKRSGRRTGDEGPEESKERCPGEEGLLQ